MTLDASPLWAWMIERQAIYIRRTSGEPWPWTDDEPMRQYKFCNVFRELDTVTIWLREHWREPYADSPHLWIALCLGRQINWPETLKELGFPTRGLDLKRLEHVLQARQLRREKVYTGAYLLSMPTGQHRGLTKSQYVARVVMGEVWRARAEFQQLFKAGQPTMADVHWWLQSFPGWGSFLAYEVVTDMRHTRYLRNAPDINTWAVAGPGSQRGLNRIHGRPLNKKVPQHQALVEMMELLTLAQRHLPEWVLPIELRTIEDGLCEMDKWLRIRNNEGETRSIYRPPTWVGMD